MNLYVQLGIEKSIFVANNLHLKSTHSHAHCTLYNTPQGAALTDPCSIQYYRSRKYAHGIEKMSPFVAVNINYGWYSEYLKTAVQQAVDMD
jgi:hypothetical protein